MAVVDPYSPCPCGSGQKFKWCCHKVEAHAERAQRLYEGGQTEAALHALDDGLKKDPGNPWLLTRKSIYLTQTGKLPEARQAAEEVLRKTPKHLGALVMVTRLALETEGPTVGAGQLQRALTAFPPGDRSKLAGLVRVVGAFLAEAGDFAAALKHLKLALVLAGGEPDPSVLSTLRTLLGSAAVSPWFKDETPLAPAPEGLSAETRDRFQQALGWAEEGLWSPAAAAFDALTADPAAAASAEKNLGLCRLWLADEAGAAEALRRYVARLGPTEEAVELEALCQLIIPDGPDDRVDQVQLTWPLRNRDALLAALRSDHHVFDEGSGPINPEDPQSAEADEFALLDRPRLSSEPLEDGGASLTVEQVPRVEGRVFVGKDTAVLEAYDDGRLDRLAERFTTLAGTSIAPAHPRTRYVGKVHRLELALAWEWILPEDVEPVHSRRLKREFGARMMREVWPNTPMSFLGGRTPLQAGHAGDSAVPLRAAILLLENNREPWQQEFDFADLRARLSVPDEPPIDPETVDPARLHLSRLARVPAERLSDEKLAALYRRARQYMIPDALEAAGVAFTNRPTEAMESQGVEPLGVYSDLASLASGRGQTDHALDLIRRGRQADTVANRAAHAPHWDMLEIRVRAQRDRPEQWVPELAVVMERYRDNAEATQPLMMSLLDMGLIQMSPNPDRSGEILLDTRPLQMLMAEYGPRVTTSSGRLGVSAARPEIWTPGGGSGGAQSGLWTPGSPAAGAAPGGEKKLIIPG